MNHPIRDISEVSAGIGSRGRGCRVQGRGGRGGQGGRGVDKGPHSTAKEIAACTHMYDQYFSGNNYRDLSPAEKAKLWQISNKRTGNDSNPRPPPSMINRVKSKINEFKVTLCDIEMGMYPNVEDNLFSDDDYSIKVNASNSVFTSQTPSGKRRNNRGV